MKRIKVVHVVPVLSPGGAERVVVHIVTGLNRQRFEAVVISLMDRRDSDLERALDESGVEVRYLGKHLGFDYRMYSRVYRVLKECRADIIHTHLQVLRYVFPSVMLLKKACVLHTVHNLAERDVEPQMRWLQRCAFRYGVVPVAVAEEVALSLERAYGISECRVIANGIPTSSYANPRTPRSGWRTKEGFAEDDVLFACVARFAAQKNHALLLNAFAEGPAADPRAHLILIGEGGLQKELEAQARNLGLSGRAHFPGLRTDIPDILGASDVFVLSSDFEGNPLSAMEAMAAGLPIVSTAVGGVPALVESGRQGLLVPPGDTQALARAMTFLLQDRESRSSWGFAAARRAREKFDVSTMVRGYEQVYEQILESGLHRKERAAAWEAAASGPS